MSAGITLRVAVVAVLVWLFLLAVWVAILFRYERRYPRERR